MKLSLHGARIGHVHYPRAGCWRLMSGLDGPVSQRLNTIFYGAILRPETLTYPLSSILRLSKI
jgi:hypothetical protein